MDEIVDWMSASQSITQSIPISFSISDRFLSISILFLSSLFFSILTTCSEMRLWEGASRRLIVLYGWKGSKESVRTMN